MIVFEEIVVCGSFVCDYGTKNCDRETFALWEFKFFVRAIAISDHFKPNVHGNPIFGVTET